MNSEKMKAIVSTAYGGPEILKLQEVEKPIPKDNEVLIKIQASSITTAETMMRTGYPLIGRLYLGLTKPKNQISGTGFAGVIEDKGKDVKQFKIGDKVFGESLDRFGTYAEYICIEEDGIIDLLPENVSYEEAAVVGDGHITSLNFLRNIANIKPHHHVLIIGASGSLGTAAVQLAKIFGAKVTAICSTKNVGLIKSLGADQVIDYKKENFTKNGHSYDIIYDTVGKSSYLKCRNSLTEKGTYMSPVLDFGLLFQMLFTSIFGKKKAKFSATGMLPHKTIRQYLKEIASLMELGELKSIISKRFPLQEIPEAHKFIDKGHKVGNAVGVMLS
ncbi:MAG: NAD(P)-dependent alcohol dehydrogenase [Bacteroidota bacterium]